MGCKILGVWDRPGRVHPNKEIPEIPWAVGPNKVILKENMRIRTPGAFGMVRPTVTKETLAPGGTTEPSPTNTTGSSEAVLESDTWKVISSSFQVLNQTNPNVTERCWLCVSIKPPYYEAIGDPDSPTYSNESSPSQCNWGQEIGITLTPVSGKGRCVGTVPKGKSDLRNATEKDLYSHKWLIQ